MIARCTVLALLLVAACARPPTALRGDYAPVSVAEALAQPDMRAQVRWGGQLIQTVPEADRTCFQVLERPLDRAARPVATDESSGRFVVCARGFFDPAVWAPGREITAVGTVDGAVTTKVGDADHRQPLVAADRVHLWPERDPYRRGSPRIGVGVGGGSSGVGGGVHIGF